MADTTPTPAADASPAPTTVKVKLADAYTNLDLTLPKGGVIDPGDPTWASMIARDILVVVG